MSLIACPYCAEDIQAEARLCKHCGQTLLQQSTMPAPVAQAPVAPAQVSPAGKLLAAMKSYGAYGKWSILLCQPDRLVVKTVIPPYIGMPILIAGAFLYYPITFLGLGVFYFLQHQRVKACAAAGSYSSVAAASDHIIPLANIRSVKWRKIWFQTNMTITTAQGRQTLMFLGQDAERVRALYPGLPTK